MARTPEQKIDTQQARNRFILSNYRAILISESSFRGRFGLPDDVPGARRRDIAEYVMREADKLYPQTNSSTRAQ